MFKWVAGTLGVVIGVAHVGVLGHIMREKPVPSLTPPVIGDYTTYRITVDENGYRVEYIGNDPRVMVEEASSEGPGGLLGMGGRQSSSTRREYTQDGARNRGGGEPGGKLTAEQIECIEAAGGGRAQGAIVGGSLASGVVVPFVSSIPYVGWLAAGWATLLGTELGGTVGAEASSIIKGC